MKKKKKTPPKKSVKKAPVDKKFVYANVIWRDKRNTPGTIEVLDLDNGGLFEINGLAAQIFINLPHFSNPLKCLEKLVPDPDPQTKKQLSTLLVSLIDKGLVKATKSNAAGN